MRPTLALLAASLVLAACATSGSGETGPKGVERFAGDPRLGEEVERICFASNIDSFSDTTRDTVTVREGRNHYLIEVYNSCFALDDTLTIALDSTGGCLSRGDHLIVSDSILGPGPRGGGPFSTQRCTVKSIYKWDPKAKDEADEKAPEEDSAEAPAES